MKTYRQRTKRRQARLKTRGTDEWNYVRARVGVPKGAVVFYSDKAGKYYTGNKGNLTTRLKDAYSYTFYAATFRKNLEQLKEITGFNDWRMVNPDRVLRGEKP